MPTLTLESATDEQLKQLARVASDAAEKAVKDYFKGVAVSKKGAQRVHASPDFAARVREATVLALADLSVTDKYKDEEVSSKYGYLSGYNGNPTLEANLADLEKELATLKGMFPELANADFDRRFVERIRKGEVVLPTGAERWILIPRQQKLAPTYSEAIQKVLDTIKEVRGRLYSYRKAMIGPDHLRQLDASVKCWEEIAKEQCGHDILVVAVQLGKKHVGRSVCRALEVFQSNEFGLGVFAVGIIILIHPKRLMHYNDLWINCVGDEFNILGESVGCWSCAPDFRFGDARVRCGVGGVNVPSERYGSASAFLPQ
jgi:hypothetical protein